MTNLLPLDIWRAEIGFEPWKFWGLADGSIIKDDSKCSGLVREYAWQGTDAAGRDDLRKAIERAEDALFGYLGYRVAPQYVETEPLPWPRFNDASQVRYRDMDATGRRVAMMAPEFHIQAMGIEQLTPIGTAGLIFSTLYGGNLLETWTAQIATTVTNPSEIAVYFTATDRLNGDGPIDRWRIQPVTVAIAGGIATITGATWLMVQPYLYDNPVLNALNPTVLTNFVSAIEVYQCTTNGDGNSVTTAQATLQYESSDCGGWGAGFCIGQTNGSTDPGTFAEVIGRAGIRDRTLGLITPAVATYNAATGLWSSMSACNCYAEPDRVKLRYLAGYPLENGVMAKRWQQIVTMLAAAELKRRICACRETNERLHDLQLDMALESTQTERYARSQRDLDSPFGTRLGHIQSWKRAQEYILRRGLAV
jgi:hypothetical protein